MRRVLFLFPAIVALASVLAIATVKRSATVRERIGRINVGEWLDGARQQRIEIESVQP